MKILVLNASPKGKNSATVHTALYLQALHPEHEFTFVPVGQRIKSYEKDLSPLRTELERADMLIFPIRSTPSSRPRSSTGSSSSSRPTAWTSPASSPRR